MPTLTAAPAARCPVRRVLDSRAVRMAFQPVVQLQDGSVLAYEALARFDAEHFASPVDAFAAAAAAGIGVELELLTLQQALTSIDDIPPGAWLTTNLSVEALLNSGVRTTLIAHADRNIIVEITEHSQVQDYAVLREAIGELRAAGILIAVDDAGAGFASLSHILQLHPDIIKLDITFTRGIDTDPVRAALIRALVAFADEAGAMLVAEGVETPAEYDTLIAIGVRLGQGYYMARPGPLPQPGRP
ncbi:EAL domain-containing protein (putative c-di-GMP-specific phosphodiesterase class I) [Krasilnikovia cinnamomea]|uniref:EAL domain-containing protein (Putative c-di-GMP-specific phosphodiesterase class I) n=1 Tax=Krasilnikovia cinnamomea TaxID=349313 RepID=A0A4Q7ZK59_9ACTN|nr:EAL domain-containing protein [Krasilnikovia cinnamomea]RZU51308.1 EAL domain-containing protein (putative c-di-GMP-specific phosphodiesterase class I) [Krasilnikovia cinnamomea]